MAAPEAVEGVRRGAGFRERKKVGLPFGKTDPLTHKTALRLAHEETERALQIVV